MRTQLFITSEWICFHWDQLRCLEHRLESLQGKSFHSKAEANAMSVSYIRAICTKVKVFQRISGDITYPELTSVGTSQWRQQADKTLALPDQVQRAHVLCASHCVCVCVCLGAREGKEHEECTFPTSTMYSFKVKSLNFNLLTSELNSVSQGRQKRCQRL